MKHKYAEMIKAKADNMDLVILVKNEQNDEDWWALKSDREVVPSFSNGEYFACLPQHAEACLHWLNGGEVQCTQCGKWIDYICSQWGTRIRWMHEKVEIRIKPRKEKRWIAVEVDTGHTTRMYETKDDCDYGEFSGCRANSSGWQFLEIEIEV